MHIFKEQRLFNPWEYTQYSGNVLCTDGRMMLQVWHLASPKQHMYQECCKWAMVHGQDEDARHTADTSQWGYNEHCQ